MDASFPNTTVGDNGIINKDLIFPLDAYHLVAWTLIWGLAHNAFKPLIKPIAIKYAKDPTPKVSEDRPPSPTRKYNLRKRSPSGTSAEITPLLAKSNKVPKNAIKFATATWKFVNYAIMTIIGAYVLAYEPWIFDTQEYFKGWPEEHSMSDKMKFYYHAAFGSGAYMLISIFTDPKQKDFYQMLTHHILTLTIVTASYLLGFYRIGSVIMLLHDVSDPFMEIAKMFVYTANQKFADMFFIVFAVVFITTRNIIYPQVIASIPRFAYHPDGRLIPYGRWDLHYFCLGCLFVLCSLQFYWGSLIVRMAAKAIIEKKVEGDIRDEDD